MKFFGKSWFSYTYRTGVVLDINDEKAIAIYHISKRKGNITTSAVFLSPELEKDQRNTLLDLMGDLVMSYMG